MPPKNPRVQMVREWLETLHLEQYADMFAAAGYDDPEAISTLDEGDLDAMRITLPGHRKRLLLNAKKYEVGERIKKMDVNRSQSGSTALAAELSRKIRGEPVPSPATPATATSTTKAPVEATPKVSEPVEEEETEPIHILNEMDMLREIEVSATSTSADAINKYTSKWNVQLPEGKCWKIFESLDVPGLERPLLEKEIMLDVKKKWPSEQTSRFSIRAVEKAVVSSASATLSGVLEKRGGSKGNARNWKTRHFEIRTRLQYHKTAPKSASQEPLGSWTYSNATAYIVTTEMKKAKKPNLCFCLKPNTDPMWPTEQKDIKAAFEDNCQFMSTASEEDRLKWLISIQLAQSASNIQATQDTTQEGSGVGNAPEDHSSDEEDDNEQQNEETKNDAPPPIPTKPRPNSALIGGWKLP
eukprot:m.104767 g.104767  ORF g.104767 m.104767 type:complete len:413 (+) comp13856_c0_seq1:184-1422(+)